VEAGVPARWRAERAGRPGFGAVYTDVGGSEFEYFDRFERSLGQSRVPPADNALSFMGVAFDTPVVGRVRIVYGNRPRRGRDRRFRRGKDADINFAPLVVATDDVRVTLEIENGGAGVCFETTLTTCVNSSPAKDSCTPDSAGTSIFWAAERPRRAGMAIRPFNAAVDL